MTWNEQIQELVAIAASAAGGCEKCLDYHLQAAREAAVDEKDILRSLKLAKRIRAVASDKLDKTIDALR